MGAVPPSSVPHCNAIGSATWTCGSTLLIGQAALPERTGPLVASSDHCCDPALMSICLRGFSLPGLAGAKRASPHPGSQMGVPRFMTWQTLAEASNRICHDRKADVPLRPLARRRPNRAGRSQYAHGG